MGWRDLGWEAIGFTGILAALIALTCLIVALVEAFK